MRRPLRQAAFNGTVLMEWQNVTAGYDLDAVLTQDDRREQPEPGLRAQDPEGAQAPRAEAAPANDAAGVTPEVKA